jgi:hypothetical protein
MDQQKSISESNCPPNEGYVMLIKSLRKRLHDEIEVLQAETEKCKSVAEGSVRWLSLR